jgi:2-oxo-4-hydroxy-4-carboxy--5-ureidoimidazoline (OHCU) decarboxylase
MLNYLILINILLFVVCIAFIFKWYTQRAYNKQLFTRALELELTLMDIYDESAEKVQKKIIHTLDNITPL